MVGVFYAYPFLKLNRRTVALRDLPYLKIWTIALVWVAVCFWAPRLNMGYSIWEKQFLIESFSLLAFVVALTIPFDIRDSKSDNPNLRTIPMLLGESKAMLLARALILLSLGTLAFQHRAETLGPSLFIELFPFVYAYVILRVDETQLKHFHLLYVDGALLMLGLSMLFTS